MKTVLAWVLATALVCYLSAQAGSAVDRWISEPSILFGHHAPNSLAGTYGR